IWTAIRSWHTVTPSFAGWGTSSREEDGLDRDRLRGGIPAVRGLDHVSGRARRRSEEHTSELQSLTNLACRLLLANNIPHIRGHAVLFGEDPPPAERLLHEGA